jgi:hypothetical protein
VEESNLKETLHQKMAQNCKTQDHLIDANNTN